jgi:hypothetical protein
MRAAALIVASAPLRTILAAGLWTARGLPADAGEKSKGLEQ